MIERFSLFRLIGCKHDDRQLTKALVGAYHLQNLYPIHNRHNDIKQYQVYILSAFKHTYGITPIFRLDNLFDLSSLRRLERSKRLSRRKMGVMP